MKPRRPEPDPALEPPFPIGQLPPRKVAWLHPLELVRTGYLAFLSRVATGFLDRREMLAAVDRGDPPGHRLNKPTLVRDKKENEGAPAVPDLPPFCTLRADPIAERDGAIWVDFVADLGDSWDATYATVTMLAKETLQVRGHDQPLPQAAVVVLGGDLVYPTPSRNAYRTRLRSAFAAAMPEAGKARTPCLLALPGNHDWYDGLTNFVREFCQGGKYGGWGLVQSRSYFAAKVAPRWWIWGIDIALDTRIDSPQQAYFLDIMKPPKPGYEKHPAQFEVGDQVILCTAKPVWLEDPRHSDDAYKNLAYFVKRIMEPHGATAAVILAGDLHHYSRYHNLKRQLITAGGGGAYLSGTHHLPYEVPALHYDAPPGSGQARTTDPAEEGYNAAQFPYPSRAESRSLAMRALMLVCRSANWSFALTVAAIYWLMAWPLRAGLDELFGQGFASFVVSVWRELIKEEYLRSYVVALAVLIGCALYALAVNKGWRVLRALWGVAHGVVHIWVALTIALVAARDNTIHRFIERNLNYWGTPMTYWELPTRFWLTELALSLVFLLIAAAAGATLVGLYLVLSDRLFAWHRNDVFAAQSIIDFRNFLRMRIGPDGSLTIYPIGLRRVPRQWRARIELDRKDDREEKQAPPCYEPGDYDLTPHMIEAPIRISVK